MSSTCTTIVCQCKEIYSPGKLYRSKPQKVGFKNLCFSSNEIGACNLSQPLVYQLVLAHHFQKRGVHRSFHWACQNCLCKPYPECDPNVTPSQRGCH